MKIRTFWRHLKEGAKNIARNGWLTFSAVSAVTITLLILGVFLLLAMNVNHMVENIENQVEIRVELNFNITESQIEAVENEVKSFGGVKAITYVPKEEGLDELKEWFGEEAYLLEGVENENPLNDVLKIRVLKPENIGAMAQYIENLQNVEYVDYGKATVDTLFITSKWIRNVGIVFIVGLAFTAMFLISNTIKMTIFNRRKEIEIMKLVGATNWFIRWPFFVEGLFLGIMGSIVPVFLLIGGYYLLLENVGTGISFFELLPLYPLAVEVSVLLVAIGAFIGVWGSMMSIRRFLKI